MTVFNGKRGFAVIDLDTSGGKGVQLTIAGGGTPVGNSSLVTSFNVVQSENYAVSQCLNGGIFLYTYGHDPQRSQFSVGVTSFLNTCSGEASSDLSQAVAAYNSGRVSAIKQQSSLSVGNGSFKGYLIGQNIESTNNEIGLVTTTYTFIALQAH